MLVETNVSLAVGVGVELGFPKLPLGLNGVETEVNLFETAFPIATECVAAGKGWEAATKIWSGAPIAGVTASGSAKASEVPTTPCSTSTDGYVQPTPKPSQGYPGQLQGNTSVAVPPTGTSGVFPSSTPPLPPIDEFTGLAGKSMAGLGMGWQFMLLGIGAVAGGMVLL